MPAVAADATMPIPMSRYPPPDPDDPPAAMCSEFGTPSPCICDPMPNSAGFSLTSLPREEMTLPKILGPSSG